MIKPRFCVSLSTGVHLTPPPPKKKNKKIKKKILKKSEIMMYVKKNRSLPRLWLFFFFEGSHIEIDMRFTSRGRRPFKVRQVSRERASD